MSLERIFYCIEAVILLLTIIAMLTILHYMGLEAMEVLMIPISLFAILLSFIIGGYFDYRIDKRDYRPPIIW